MFRARCEAGTCPKQNDTSLDDLIRPLGLRCLERGVWFESSMKRSAKILVFFNSKIAATYCNASLGRSRSPSGDRNRIAYEI